MTVFRRLLPLLFAVAVIVNCWELATFTIMHWNGSTGIQTPRQVDSETGPLPPGTEPAMFTAISARLDRLEATLGDGVRREPRL